MASTRVVDYSGSLTSLRHIGSVWLGERMKARACSVHIPTWEDPDAESANINRGAVSCGRMASGTHTRALGTPPAQIRTYEDVSTSVPFSICLHLVKKSEKFL